MKVLLGTRRGTWVGHRRREVPRNNGPTDATVRPNCGTPRVGLNTRYFVPQIHVQLVLNLRQDISQGNSPNFLPSFAPKLSSNYEPITDAPRAGAEGTQVPALNYFLKSINNPLAPQKIRAPRANYRRITAPFQEIHAWLHAYLHNRAS